MYFSDITVKIYLAEFYPQDGGEGQLALKLRHCHSVYCDDAAAGGGVWAVQVVRRDTERVVARQHAAGRRWVLPGRRRRVGRATLLLPRRRHVASSRRRRMPRTARRRSVCVHGRSRLSIKSGPAM